MQGVSIANSYDNNFSNDYYFKFFVLIVMKYLVLVYGQCKQGSNMIVSNFISGIELTDGSIKIWYDMGIASK